MLNMKTANTSCHLNEVATSIKAVAINVNSAADEREGGAIGAFDYLNIDAALMPAP